MSTVAKGDTFEQSVFDALSEELKGDRLGLSPSTAKLFRKKGYYSHDRKTDIIVDMSIEVWPPDADNYSILWVCECKDYGHPIPVDDVEEFKAKLDQIAGKNVKGVRDIHLEWDVVLREANRWCDRAVAAAEKKTFAERKRAFDAIVGDLKQAAERPESRSIPTKLSPGSWKATSQSRCVSAGR